MSRRFNRNLIEEMLADFSFEEILELNDLTSEDVLELLFDNGLVNEPLNIIRSYENDVTWSKEPE